jgi:hypothetical protein
MRIAARAKPTVLSSLTKSLLDSSKLLEDFTEQADYECIKLDSCYGDNPQMADRLARDFRLLDTGQLITAVVFKIICLIMELTYHHLG